jgi:hypothetical protein
MRMLNGQGEGSRCFGWWSLRATICAFKLSHAVLGSTLSRDWVMPAASSQLLQRTHPLAQEACGLLDLARHHDL